MVNWWLQGWRVACPEGGIVWKVHLIRRAQSTCPRRIRFLVFTPTGAQRSSALKPCRAFGHGRVGSSSSCQRESQGGSHSPCLDRMEGASLALGSNPSPATHRLSGLRPATWPLSLGVASNTGHIVGSRCFPLPPPTSSADAWRWVMTGGVISLRDIFTLIGDFNASEPQRNDVPL